MGCEKAGVPGPKLPRKLIQVGIISLICCKENVVSAFTCDKGGFLSRSAKEIPDQHVNDDYCDCDDGTDEPGTNACALLTGPAFSGQPAPLFRCKDTKGYEPFNVPSHMFGDGVCDCCDGSDEPGGGCKDLCKEWYEAAAAEREAAHESRRKGEELYATYSTEGQAAIEEAAKLVQEKQTEASTAEMSEKEAEKRKDITLEEQNKERKARAEAAEAAFVEGVKLSSLAGGSVARVALLVRFAVAVPNDVGHEALMATVVENMDDNVTDHMDDVEVLSLAMEASEAMNGPREASEGNIENGDGDESGKEGEGEGDENAAEVSPDGSVEEKTADGNALRPTYPGAFGTSPDLEAALQAFGAALPLAPTYEEGDHSAAVDHEALLEKMLLKLATDLKQRALLSKLVRVSLQPGGFSENAAAIVEGVEHAAGGSEEDMDVDWNSWESPAYKEADHAWREAQKATRTAKDVLRDAESKVGIDFGPQSAFYRLSRTCFEVKADGFLYKICPFTDARQDHTLLGSWGRWVTTEDPAAAKRSALASVPGRMLFEDGEKCWNGPRRTLEVTFTCGAEDKVLEVREPDVCRYTAQMTTPAACGERTDASGNPLA
jgi:protein kinase C substrate 80K-H